MKYNCFLSILLFAINYNLLLAQNLGEVEQGLADTDTAKTELIPDEKPAEEPTDSLSPAKVEVQTHTLSGVVVDADGKGVKKALVSLIVNGESIKDVKANWKGKFKFKKVPAGEYSLNVSHVGKETSELLVTLTDDKDVGNITLSSIALFAADTLTAAPEVAQISGVVVDADGKGVKKALVSLIANGELIKDVKASWKGKFKFKQVPVGEYTLKVSHVENEPTELLVTLIDDKDVGNIALSARIPVAADTLTAVPVAADTLTAVPVAADTLTAVPESAKRADALPAYLILGCGGNIDSSGYIYCQKEKNSIVDLSKIPLENKEIDTQTAAPDAAKMSDVVSFLVEAIRDEHTGVTTIYDYNKVENIISDLYENFNVFPEKKLNDIQFFLKMHKSCGVYLRLVPKETVFQRIKNFNSRLADYMGDHPTLFIILLLLFTVTTSVVIGGDGASLGPPPDFPF